MTTDTATIATAIAAFQARRSRRAHPAGHFDRGGRWYPSDEETLPCCGSVRWPSRSYPYSLMLHCRTVEHVARLHDVSVAELRRAVRRPADRPDGIYYKAVAVAGGRLLSIYDGTTEYLPGVPLTQAVRREHGGGYYVYATANAAAHAELPRDARLRDAPRAVLQVKCSGQYTRYTDPDGAGPDKWCWSTICPVALVATPAHGPASSVA